MNLKQFDIQILDIHWLEETPEEIDQCAHGQLKIRIGDEIVIDRQEKSNHWTLSAMAIHLLRTTQNNHDKGNLVAEHLVPCCGHHIDHLVDEIDVHIQGCMTGKNFWVKHNNETIHLATEEGTEIKLEKQEYINEIINFVDKVERFYKESKSKIEPTDEYDRIGLRKFWDEWLRRRTSLGVKRHDNN